MTIASATNKSGPYFYNGSATSFAYQFKISNAAHIRVVETVIATGVETDLVLNADYTVTGVGSDTGNVVITPARATGKSVTLVRNVPFTQLTVLENQGAYFAKVVEAALDAGVSRDQQLQEQISRAVVVPVSADATDLEDLIAGVIALLDNVDAVVTVAGISGDVETVAANATALSTVYTNVAAVVVVATNIATIIAVPALATQVAADKATVAADKATVAADKATVATNTTTTNTNAGLTAADKIATAADRVQTGLDRVQTAADRVQTGLDRAAAAASAASVVAADIVHYTAETNSAARQAQARKNIGIELGYPLLHVQEELAASTNPGDSVATAVQTRNLNTVKNNEISGASLATNQVTLPVGTYWIELEAPGYQCGRTRLYLYDATGSSYLLIGAASESAATDASATVATLSGRLVVSGSSKNFTIRQYTEALKTSNGLGRPVNHSGLNEVYAIFKAWKLN